MLQVSVTQLAILGLVAFSLVSFSEAYVSIGESCDQASSETACLPSGDLACRNGICECIVPNEMEWNANRTKCVVFAEKSCYKSSGSIFTCVDDAYCQWQSDYTQRKCVCNYQRSPTSDGHCKKSHGASCGISLECNSEDKLICNNGQCRCPAPLNHVFKEGRNRCFIKVGAPCERNPGNGAVTCDPEENECLADLESNTGYSCQCLAGNHMEHFARQCVRGNGIVCEDDFGTRLHPPCDVVAGLQCNNKKCQCNMFPDMDWDEKQQACAVLEGRGCSLIDPIEYPWISYGEYYFQCFTGLECKALDDHEFEGVCRKITKEL